MSAHGSRYDNAVAQSFFASLKRERCKRTRCPTREAAKADVCYYIERSYNRKPTHSHLGYASPVQYEKQAVGT